MAERGCCCIYTSAVYVTWKYAKVWELTRKHQSGTKMP